MKKSVTKISWICVFLFVLYGIPLLWLAAGSRTEAGTYENRNAAEMPKLTWRENGWEAVEAYPSAYEAYYNDHLPFRSQWIYLNSQMEYSLFQSSPNTEVVRGKDGWLFYNNVLDDNSIETYKGMNLFRHEELEQIKENLLSVREELVQNGVSEFVLLIAPNKERIYEEKMPDYYGEPAGEYRTKQLIEYLREHTDIRIVYPYKELKAAKLSRQVYYRLDTHWNKIGGYVGSGALLRELGVSLTPLEELTITKTEPTVCDLADMISMRAYLNTDADYVLDGYDIYEMQMEEQETAGEYVYRCGSGDERKLFMVGDSFADAMREYTASRFLRSCMVHYSGAYWEALQREQPDIFVYELVERRVGSLLEPINQQKSYLP